MDVSSTFHDDDKGGAMVCIKVSTLRSCSHREHCFSGVQSRHANVALHPTQKKGYFFVG